MKKALLVLLLGAATHGLHAQSISRQVVAAAGGTTSNSAGSLSSTVGEIVIATATSGSFLLTQGFQQPDANPTGIANTKQVLVNYNLYPNPAQDAITLSLQSEGNFSASFYIYDAAGRLLLQEDKAAVSTTKYSRTFNISSFTTGNYFLKVVNLSGSEVKTIPFTKN